MTRTNRTVSIAPNAQAITEREAIVKFILKRMDFFERMMGSHDRAIILEMSNLVRDIRHGVHHV